METKERIKARDYDLKEVEQSMQYISGEVKLVCGIANNAAWLCMMEAIDKAKTLPQYKQRVKAAYGTVIKEWKRYEGCLLYGKDIHLFRLSDLHPESRKRYGDITDREYYDFWVGSGCAAYVRTFPLIGSLQNKFRLALQRAGAKDADVLGWLLVASATLELAVCIWRRVIKTCAQEAHIPECVLQKVFEVLSLERISKAWEKAIALTDNHNYPIEETDQRNIELGVKQLDEAWHSPEIVYGSLSDAIKDYDEVWCSNSEMKKYIRRIRDMQHEAEQIISEDKIELMKRELQERRKLCENKNMAS